MASSHSSTRFMAVLFAAMFLVSAAAALTCNDVINDLKPCIQYLRSGSGAPPSACCAGASTLASAAASTADKQAACACLKNSAKSLNLKPELAKSLPSNCGISLPIEVSPTVDCSKIS